MSYSLQTKSLSEAFKFNRDRVLLPEIKVRLAVEAASPQGWCEWVGDQGKMIGISESGSSAPYKELYGHYGITVKNIVSTAKKMLMI